MSLPPVFAYTRIGSPSAPHSLEIWLDYVCPYSAKIVKNAINPIIKEAVLSGDLKGKVAFYFRHQVQSWHGSSLFTHEVATAVGRVCPDSFWDYTLLLMERQGEFFDRPVADKTPTQIREELVALAGEVPSIDKSKLAAIKDLVTYKTTPNGGVDVTEDLKWFTKVARQNGIHVSPTAVWDGLKNDSVSSSWGQKEWSEFFKANVKV